VVPVGRLSSLIRFEASRLLRFPLLEIIVVLAVFDSFRSYMSVSLMGVAGGAPASLIELKLLRMAFYAMVHCPFVPLVYAATTSSIAHAISSGLMRNLLSFPYRRREVFVVEFLVAFTAPLAIFLAAYLLPYPFFYPHSVRVGPECLSWLLAAILSFLYVFSICLAASLAFKAPVPSFMSSVSVLYGVSFIAAGMRRSPVLRFIPPYCFSDFIMGPADVCYLVPSSLLAIAIIAACYVYFTRWLEL